MNATSIFSAIPSRAFVFSASVVLATGAVFAFVASASATAPQPGVTAPLLTDANVPAFQRDLLDVAFRSATALPVNPHARNRARAQEAVARTCLELDQAARARVFIDQIDDWRRGAAYADLAYHCALHGRAVAAPEFIEQARVVAEAQARAAGEGEIANAWQRDRIRAKIARAHLALGDARAAEPFTTNLTDSEAGRVLAQRAQGTAEETFACELGSLDTIVAGGSFDQIRAALDAYVGLWTRFQADDAKRARVEERLEGVWQRLPAQVGIEARFELARGAIEHGDPARARTWLTTARAIVNGAKWTPDVHVSLHARLGALLHRAGLADEARDEVSGALAWFDEQYGSITDVERAGALRSVAEAWSTLGDGAASLRTYRRALEAGIANPNSRPRAEDLSATCRSMAVAGVEPDAETWTRIRAILDGLGAPW